MAFAQIELTLQGIEGAARALGQLAQTDLEDLTFAVSEVLAGSTRDRFDQGKAPDGSAWVPWSEDYALTRHGGHSLLISGGDLQESVQNISTGLTVRVGAHRSYAAIQQFGGKAGRGRKVTIPARPYLGLSDQDIEAVERLVTERLSGVFE